MARKMNAQTVAIKEWMIGHQGTYITAQELGKELGLPTKTVGNAFHSLQRNGTISSGSIKGTYGYPGTVTVRETFKVARETTAAPKPEPRPIPAMYSGKVHRDLMRLIRGPMREGRVSILSATGAIIWNSAEQRTNMRRMGVKA